MAKKQIGKTNGAPPPADGDDPGAADDPARVTTLKASVRVARVVSQLAAHLGVRNQDVLDRYVKVLEDDLLRLMVERTAEIEGLKRRDP